MALSSSITVARCNSNPQNSIRQLSVLFCFLSVRFILSSISVICFLEKVQSLWGGVVRVLRMDVLSVVVSEFGQSFQLCPCQYHLQQRVWLWSSF